jgi:hypothetical protein
MNLNLVPQCPSLAQNITLVYNIMYHTDLVTNKETEANFFY